MRKTTSFMIAIGSAAFALGATAGTTVYQSDSGISVNQSSPPGAIANEQVLIIDNDKFGNQRILSIGAGKGTVITGPQPCKRDAPTPNMDCVGHDLRDVQWDGKRLSSGQFEDADLRGASMRGAQLDNATFGNARLNGADLGKAQLVNTSFPGANLTDARLDGAELVNADFTNADLSGSSLRNASMVNASFADADLSGADLSGASLINADFMAARLAGATWVDGSRCAKDSGSSCRR